MEQQSQPMPFRCACGGTFKPTESTRTQSASGTTESQWYTCERCGERGLNVRAAEPEEPREEQTRSE
jgi:C4-type Zn-finger protein